MEWKVVKCQDVIDIRDGTHDTPKYVNVGYPLITSKISKMDQLIFQKFHIFLLKIILRLINVQKLIKGIFY